MDTAFPTTTPNRSRSNATSIEVEPKVVHQWRSAGDCLLVDVREPDEHARERIPGARLLPLSKFDPALLDARSGQRIVFHCRSGGRSAEAARIASVLQDRGVQVHSLRGGIEAWKAQSLPVEVDRRAPRLSVMRQTQLVIGVTVLLGAAIGYFLHPAGYALSALMGAGLTMAGATGACPLAAGLGKLPWNRVPALRDP